MARTSRAASIAAGLKRIQLKPNQRNYVDTIDKNDITFCYGPAGTSKTFTACYTALEMLQEKKIKEIILCKPIQEAGEKLGVLPGNKDEKIDPYMKSYKSNIEKIIGVEKTKTLFDKNTIRFEPLAYMRGDTFDDALMILDEAQNASSIQMKMFLTRLGIESKAIITGDASQIDLPNKSNSGLIDVLKILKNINDIGIVKLSEHDIARHHLVKDIIDAYSKSSK